MVKRMMLVLIGAGLLTGGAGCVAYTPGVAVGVGPAFVRPAYPVYPVFGYAYPYWGRHYGYYGGWHRGYWR